MPDQNWRCWFPGAEDEEDGCSIRSSHASWAAELLRDNDQGDWAMEDNVHVHVRGPDGALHRFIVSREAVPHYTARHDEGASE